TYPYAHRSSLNDVTTGKSGSCVDSTVLCTAGIGWDGPTGLGTPNGVAALMPTPRPSSSVTATGGTTTYGISGAVHATVSSPPGATGTVRVFNGTRVLGTATLVGANATVRLLGTGLRPGTHTLAVRYLGSLLVRPSSTAVHVRVVEATTRVGARVLDSQVVVNNTKPRVAVRVTAPGFTVAGAVVIKRGTLKVGSGRLHLGRVTVTAAAFKRAGKQRLTVHYLGSSLAKPSSTSLVVTVLRR
ncbi:MAG: Ig-like domain repeat protein, partial [Nocardioidaceae bacterium]